MLSSGTNAIVVNAPDTDVVLRGLTIDNTTACGGADANGIRVLAARAVRVEVTTIPAFTGAGILADPDPDAGAMTPDRQRACATAARPG